MSRHDWFSIGTAVIGVALAVVTALAPPEIKRRYIKFKLAGFYVGIFIFGFGIYLGLIGLLPVNAGLSHMPKISMILGVILLAGGFVWQIASGNAQMTSDPTKTLSEEPIIGTDIERKSQGGAAAGIDVRGSKDQAGPSVGLDTSVQVLPGRSGIGTRVIQSGPGTGLKISVGGDGPATGMRSRVISGEPDKVADPRAFYALVMNFSACLSMRQTKATMFRPANVLA